MATARPPAQKREPKKQAAAKPKAASTSAKKAARRPAVAKTAKKSKSTKKSTTAKRATTKTKRNAEVADRLDRYRSMRDFSITSEPSGSGPPDAAGGNRFVVQRHRATRLHYDLRLEMNGVLVSWAVPKGPTLDPKARHLAVHVEDHPLDYYDFEGVIPRGEYGGGDVIIWDWGRWAPADGKDTSGWVEAGELHFDLVGKKLAGRFVLVESKGRGKNQWLLLHKGDDHAVPGWDPEDHPTSVKSGCTNDEVAAAPSAEWHSDGARAPESISPPSWEPPTSQELAALDELGAQGEWDLQGHPVKLTNLDKVLFPARGKEAPITKREIIRYYACVAPHMLPYLAGRPLNSNRFPDGVHTKGFWQKAVPKHAPDWLNRWRYEDARKGETQWYMVADHPAALAWLANYGALELHPWTSTTASAHEPTWAFIDIDPGPENDFDDVLLLARLFRTALDHLGVKGGPKVTGKRGIQIWVPVAAGLTFDDTRAWVEALSRAVGATVPELVSWAWQKTDRHGKARLDYTQNAINKTLVAPFSARPEAGAPVSVPITWDELEDPDLRPDRWTVRNVLDRLGADGDPLVELIGLQQELTPL